MMYASQISILLIPLINVTLCSYQKSRIMLSTISFEKRFLQPIIDILKYYVYGAN